jgi:hypothetical protein
MLEESHVFHGDYSATQMFRNLRQRSQNPPFDEKLTYEVLVVGVYLRDKTGLVVLQLTEIGEILRVVPQQAADAEDPAQHNGCRYDQGDLPPSPRTPGRRLSRSIGELNWPVN